MNINGTLTLSTVGGFPTGTVLDHYECTAVGVNPVNKYTQNILPGGTSMSLQNVNADTYTVTVQAKDVNGNNLGSPISGQITISTPTVSLQLPTAISLSQG